MLIEKEQSLKLKAMFCLRFRGESLEVSIAINVLVSGILVSKLIQLRFTLVVHSLI